MWMSFSLQAAVEEFIFILTYTVGHGSYLVVDNLGRLLKCLKDTK